MPPNTRTGGQIVADALVLHGADLAFCVPGESFLGTLDGLYGHRERFRLIACRHEASAVNMAEAAGKLTGRPGIAFVTRGPGATQGAVGVHTAFHDSTPLILFVGQVSRAHLGREAFQEVDFTRLFGPIAKWAVQVDDPAKLPEIIAEAFHVAMSGRRGPVVIALPEDVQTEMCGAPDMPPKPVETAGPTDADLVGVQTLLFAATAPLVILGGHDWTQAGLDAMGHFIERMKLPVALAFRRKDLFDNTHPQFAGDLIVVPDANLANRVKTADLIIAVGTRLSDIVTCGYTLLNPPNPTQKLIHVHPGAGVLNKVYLADLAITADVNAFAERLALVPPVNPVWEEWTQAARADYEAFTVPRPVPGAVDPAAIFARLAEHLPEDAVIANGAGNYAIWHHRYFRHRRYGTYLGPTSGAMGYGVPAALAAKALNPDRTVVALAGDGCFMMAAAELATAMQYGLPIVVIVVNNGMFGTIRMHQEKLYPGRTIGTDLKNPDFAALARAHGGHGETVTATADFWPALDRCLASGVVSVIDLRVDPEAITPSATLSAIRATGKK